MQNLKNIERWRTIAAGEMCTFDGNKRRKVRLEVNAPDETCLFITGANLSEPVFLARVVGLETIEFITEGNFDLSADGEVNIYSSEFEKVAMEPTSPSLTKIMQRRSRNPELEEMFYRLQQNTDARLAKQQAEYERRINETLKSVNAGNAKPATKPAGKPVDSGKSANSDVTSQNTGNGDEPAKPDVSGNAGESSSGKGDGLQSSGK